MVFNMATSEDLHSLKHLHSRFKVIPCVEVPWTGGIESLGFPENIVVKGHHISASRERDYWSYDYKLKKEIFSGDINSLQKEPFFVSIDYDYYNHDRNVTIGDDLKDLIANFESLKIIDKENHYHDYHSYINPDYSQKLARFGNVIVLAQKEGHRFLIVAPWKIAEKCFGLKVKENLILEISNGTFLKLSRGWFDEYLKNINFCINDFRDEVFGFDYTLEAINCITRQIPMNQENIKSFVSEAYKSKLPIPKLKISGINKSWTRIQPYFNELDLYSLCCCRSLARISNKTINGVKISSVFNELFKDVNSTKDIKDIFKSMSKSHIDDFICDLDIYKNKRKAILKSQSNRAFSKIMEDIESLTIDKKIHKRTWKAISEGKLPIGIFFRKKEQYYLLNDNWNLWEEMFKRGHGEIACEIAKSAAGRTTYEKDLMSYFYFLLYGLPEYLKKHTGKKWTCFPKYIATESELEPPKEEGGLVRKRSALTPVADNESCTVEVPYAAIALHGRMTTYCYSHDYHVLTRGFSFNGNVVTQDLDKKLNGRDDYGLMFYTLTGSFQARGYPTFLIIFERREKFNDTRVHFHRTHPSRSKDGDYNAIHNWTKVCYNWMIGNIKRDRIMAQQGDLAFVKIKTDSNDDSLEGAAVTELSFDHKVEQYDNHCFSEPVAFAEYTKKARSNILGYIQLKRDTVLNHNEHDNETIPAGTYAIHQCRSWEANPKGVWSLRID